MTRQTKTPRQRAEEALAVEERRVKKLAAKRAALQGQINLVAAELKAAVARLDHLETHPDLVTKPGTTQQATTSTSGGTNR